MKTIAIIQGRRASTRLPDKVLLRLGKQTTLEHVFERASKISSVSEVWFAGVNNPNERILEKFSSKHGIKSFLGDAEDVQSRFVEIVRRSNAEQFIRLTADCPLLDPNLADRLVTKAQEISADYGRLVGFPHGLDAEYVNTRAFLQSRFRSRNVAHKEHVTLELANSSESIALHLCLDEAERFVTKNQSRWVLDYPSDYDFLKEVFEKLPSPEETYSWLDVKNFLAATPSIIHKQPELAKSWLENFRTRANKVGLKSDQLYNQTGPLIRRVLYKSPTGNISDNRANKCGR